MYLLKLGTIALGKLDSASKPIRQAGRGEYVRNVLGAAFSAGGLSGGLYAIGQRLGEDSGKIALPPAAQIAIYAAAVGAGAYTLYEVYRALRHHHV